ncbi:MAG TPA: contractile injection system protein, VgrG/Pvc8 family [Myxococcales bacterium]|nr:contractile injection system protein, VgrG/Pvc8 family [Myxococcales bacterium]
MPEADTSHDLEVIRPTIRLEGQADARVSGLINSMLVDEAEGGLSSMELNLAAMGRLEDGDVQQLFEDEQLIKLGTNISVYTGPVDTPTEVFRGVVTGLEGRWAYDASPSLVVLAEDALQKSRMKRKNKVHEDAVISDLASSIASDLGLTPQVTGFSENIGLQVQWNESDLAFLRRLLSTRDGDLQVVGSELHVTKRADVQRGRLTLELYNDLLRVRVTADLAHQVTAVTTAGWNALEGSAVSARSTGSDAGPGSGRKGADLLQQTLGERVEHLGGVPVSTDGQATAVADAAFDSRARRFVCVDGTTKGTPELRVGTQVELKGLSKRWDNTYYVVRACHRYDLERGYETDFQAESSFLGEP